MEELRKKHREEQHVLQSRITQKKKAATKKTRKGVNDECAELERQLKERQKEELLEVTGEDHTGDDDGATVQGVEEIIHDGNAPEIAADHTLLKSETEARAQSKKPNRQKARLARRAAEQEAATAQAVVEAARLPDLREQERLVFSREFESRGLKENAIRPDGHCMYSAVADQLVSRGASLVNDGMSLIKPDYRLVRLVAADFITKHPDDFSPFLEEPVEDYIVKIRDTAEWGGQLELSALARAYNTDINVLQGDGRVEKITAGVGETENPLWLAYYRHSFGLGEHYNSLRANP
ncbi:hypothetical protein MMC13_000324 [Lambiella insularis]|nr:hypothetical protein [Lambiella insularis]